MPSKNETTNDISNMINILSKKIKILHDKVNDLCKNTGDCDRIKKVNQELNSKKDEK